MIVGKSRAACVLPTSATRSSNALSTCLSDWQFRTGDARAAASEDTSKDYAKNWAHFARWRRMADPIDKVCGPRRATAPAELSSSSKSSALQRRGNRSVTPTPCGALHFEFKGEFWNASAIIAPAAFTAPVPSAAPQAPALSQQPAQQSVPSAPALW